MTDAHEEKVKKLAETLKSTGLATSETSALTMARDILQTETRQQKALDERRFDPKLNPQQRGKPAPGSAGTQSSAARIAGEAGLSTDKPVSELLKEQEGRAPSASQLTASGPRDPSASRQSAPPAQRPAQSAPTAQSQAPAPRQEPAPAPESIDPAPAATPPRPAQPAPRQADPAPGPANMEGSDPAQKAFSLMRQAAERQERHAAERKAAPQNAPAQSSAPAQQPSSAPAQKKEQEQQKVDLTEMFNFAKRGK